MKLWEAALYGFLLQCNTWSCPCDRTFPRACPTYALYLAGNAGVFFLLSRAPHPIGLHLPLLLLCGVGFARIYDSFHAKQPSWPIAASLVESAVCALCIPCADIQDTLPFLLGQGLSFLVGRYAFSKMGCTLYPWCTRLSGLATVLLSAHSMTAYCIR